jgi:hypothetical protein
MEEIEFERKEKLHQELLDGLHKLYITKNHDYGDSVHNTYEKYGLTSYLVRMEDKLNRARALDKKEEVSRVLDEKLEDTLLDLANYAILAVIDLKLDGMLIPNEEIKIRPDKNILSRCVERANKYDNIMEEHYGREK